MTVRNFTRLSNTYHFLFSTDVDKIRSNTSDSNRSQTQCTPKTTMRRIRWLMDPFQMRFRFATTTFSLLYKTNINKKNKVAPGFTKPRNNICTRQLARQTIHNRPALIDKYSKRIPICDVDADKIGHFIYRRFRMSPIVR